MTDLWIKVTRIDWSLRKWKVKNIEVEKREMLNVQTMQIKKVKKAHRHYRYYGLQGSILEKMYECDRVNSNERSCWSLSILILRSMTLLNHRFAISTTLQMETIYFRLLSISLFFIRLFWCISSEGLASILSSTGRISDIQCVYRVSRSKFKFCQRLNAARKTTEYLSGMDITSDKD